MTDHHTLTRLAAHQPSPGPAAATGPDAVPRWPAWCGAGFVVAALVGNGLTGGVTADEPLGELVALAGSGAARAGLALELVGFLLLIGWVAHLGQRAAHTGAGNLLLVAGTTAVAVKLGSGALLLAGVHHAGELDEATAVALVASNEAAFGLFWLPFGLFVAATAAALAGRFGGATRVLGLGLGLLTAAAGVVGSVDADLIVPVPFLLALLWVAVVSVRLGLARR